LRVQVQDTLMPATEDGTPSKFLEVVGPSVALRAEQAQHPQAAQAEHHQMPTDNLRLRMKDTLLKATKDGSLLVAMQTSLTEQADKRAVDNQLIPTDELTEQVRDILSKAKQDDMLGATLEHAIAGDEDVVGIEDIRTRARDVLLVSCKDIMGNEVTQKVAKDTAEHSDAVASVLTEVKNDWTSGSTLEAGVAECPSGTDAREDPLDPKPEDLQVRMKDTLRQATSNGSLHTAMQKALRDIKEAEVRTKVIDVLVQATGAGTVEGALEHGSG